LLSPALRSVWEALERSQSLLSQVPTDCCGQTTSRWWEKDSEPGSDVRLCSVVNSPNARYGIRVLLMPCRKPGCLCRSTAVLFAGPEAAEVDYLCPLSLALHMARAVGTMDAES
jgi:hypothetical protein